MRDPQPRSAMADLALDTAAAASGFVVSLVLLWYLHGDWQPGWALLCGLLAGVLLRRAVRPSYASFPPYLRGPLGTGIVVLGTIVASWATLVRHPSSYWLLRWREATTLPLLAAVLGLGLAGVIYSHSRMRAEIEEARAREAALREAALRARLRALQAQINPHFLFNAFNALAELTHQDPDVAEDMVADLAHLLRYTLRTSAEGSVALSQELEAVDRYLRVEKARLGDRLQVSWSVDPAARGVPVPGLILQPLVENAVQHAVAPRPGGGEVHIEILREPEQAVIRVRDDGPGLPPGMIARLDVRRVDPAASVEIAHGSGGAGGGLANVLQRLAFGYRGRATLRAESDEQGTLIEVRIPTRSEGE